MKFMGMMNKIWEKKILKKHQRYEKSSKKEVDTHKEVLNFFLKKNQHLHTTTWTHYHHTYTKKYVHVMLCVVSSIFPAVKWDHRVVKMLVCKSTLLIHPESLLCFSMLFSLHFSLLFMSSLYFFSLPFPASTFNNCLYFFFSASQLYSIYVLSKRHSFRFFAFMIPPWKVRVLKILPFCIFIIYKERERGRVRKYQIHMCLVYYMISSCKCYPFNHFFYISWF